MFFYSRISKKTLYNFFAPQLLDMQRTFLDEPYQSFDIIRKKTQMFLAGFKSHVECGGAPVALADIGDWTAPLLNPDPYPDGYFR